MQVKQKMIEINQNASSNEGKTRLHTQSGESFGDILAMFSLLGKSPDFDRQSASAMLEKLEGKNDGNKIESENVSEEDFSILSVLAGGIQQMQHLQEVLRKLPLNDSISPTALHSSSMSNLPLPFDGSKIKNKSLQIDDGFNQLPEQQLRNMDEAMPLLTQFIGELRSKHIQKSSAASVSDNNTLALSEVKAILAQWSQKEKGADPNPVSSRDQMSTIMKFSGVLQSNENETMSNMIEDKLQSKIAGLHKENKFSLNSLVSNDSSENGVFSDGKKQEVYKEIQPRLSLDKNQVMLSAMTKPGTRILERNKVAQNPLYKKMDDPTKSNSLSFVINHPLQAPVEGNLSRVQSPPPIVQVSNFVPEANEWIRNYIRVLDGQSGSTEARLSLNPEHLGPVEIKITSHQGQVSAEILTNTSSAKEALEGQLQNLRHALQQSGIIVQKLDIVQQAQGAVDLNQANLSFSQGNYNSSKEQRTFTSAQDLSKKQKKSDQQDLENDSLAVPYGGMAKRMSTTIDFTA